jgi:hypothetical protein
VADEKEQKRRLACAYGSHDFHDSSVEGHVECSRCGAVYAKPIGVTQHAGWAGSPAFPPANRCGWDLCGEPSHRAIPPGGES